MDRLLREGNPPTGQLASPKPQYKDVQTNSWEELKGEGGASYVKDKDVFAKLEQARALLNAISGKDFATQTTLAAVLTKLADLESELTTIKANQLSGNQKVQLSGASGSIISPATEEKLEQVRQLLSGVATEAKLEQARTLLDAISTKDFATASKQDALNIAVEDLKSELNLVKSELANIKANQISGDQIATLKDASGNVVSPATEDKLEQVRQLLAGVATEAKLEQARTLLDAISTKDFATQTTLAAVLAKLADLESELATIKANQLSGDQKVQLSGTTMELYGVSIADRPPAGTVLAGTTFTIVDESGYFQTWISDGTKWVEV